MRSAAFFASRYCYYAAGSTGEKWKIVVGFANGEPGHSRTTETIYEQAVVMHDTLVKCIFVYICIYVYVYVSVTSNPLACKLDCHILHAKALLAILFLTECIYL